MEYDRRFYLGVAGGKPWYLTNSIDGGIVQRLRWSESHGCILGKMWILAYASTSIAI
jgi:hypothetical protein